MRILAVDDEPFFLEVLEVAMRNLGFTEFTPIYSAREALREMESGKLHFDCVLLDIRMPGMTGVELCRNIRKVTGYKHTPIMMITAHSDRELIEDAFTAGASDYLTKPLDPLELKARMIMLQRVAAEQARNIRIEQSSDEMAPSDGEDFEPLEFTLDAALRLRGLDRIVDKRVFENYLLSLSTKDSNAAAVFAVSISNAAVLYDTVPRVDFMNMLHDVGVTLETVLKHYKALIAYVGSGTFVVGMIGTQDPEMHLVESLIHQRLTGFRQMYDRDNLHEPKISVGPLMRKALFSRPHAVDLPRAAIVAVENERVLEKITRRNTL